jgi:hypothetical protein
MGVTRGKFGAICCRDAQHAYASLSALRWRNIFVIPTVIFPVAATIVHTIVVLKTSSVKPTDDLHCDSSDPEW